MATMDGLVDISGTWAAHTGSGNRDLVLFQKGSLLFGYWHTETSGWERAFRVRGTLKGFNAHLSFTQYVPGVITGNEVEAFYADITFAYDGESFIGGHSYYGLGWAGFRQDGVVSIELGPTGLPLEPLSTLSLMVQVAGSPDKTVNWIATGGIIQSQDLFTALYTAPKSAGEYLVTARPAADASKSGIATFNVIAVNQPRLEVQPASIQLFKGAVQVFSVASEGLLDESVIWSCSGGSIDAAGQFTAPGALGTYTVTATSVANPDLRDSATVTVVAQASAEKVFSYDENGNMVSDGERVFEWDAENRLVAVVITATGHRSELGYDGLGRRVQIRELDSDATQTLQVSSDKKYLWDGVEIAEERNETDDIVLKHFYSQGFVDSDGTLLFYARDHLGSVRELTDITQVVRARYDYDPYGRMAKIQGDRDSLFGYTGHFWHGHSGLNFALFRAYNANIGRWIQRDPIDESGGANLYCYVSNNVVNKSDLLGLCPSDPLAVIYCVEKNRTTI